MSMDWTDDDVTAGMAVLPKEWDDTDKHQRLWIVKSVLAAVAPAIAERAVERFKPLLDALDKEFGQPEDGDQIDAERIILNHWLRRAEAVTDE